ncbi:MAG: lysylphosphatidylglycerol synthase transmembrane domain-containing protein [Acutalibacteraceae bacterium]|jgi:uncharacterized protein (TIRG00374 family)
MFKNSRSQVRNLLVLAALIVLTFYLLLRRLDPGAMWAVMLRADKKYLLVGLAMVLAFLWGEGRCYQVILKPLGNRVPLYHGFSYACIDFYFAAITPSATGGQPAVAYYMAKRGVPVARSGLVLLLYTVVYKAVLMALGLVAVCVFPGLIFDGKWYFKVLFALGVVINVVVMALFLLAMFSRTLMPRLGRRLIRWGGKLRLIKRPKAALESLERHLKEYHDGARFIRQNPSVTLRTFLWTLAQRLAMFSVSYWVYLSLGGGALSLPYLIAVQVVISIAVDSLPLPGAVGAAETMFLALYGTVYPPHLLEPALLLTRGLNYYGCLLLCSVVFLITRQMLSGRTLHGQPRA